jgi:hypothetical protein
MTRLGIQGVISGDPLEYEWSAGRFSGEIQKSSLDRVSGPLIDSFRAIVPIA